MINEIKTPLVATFVSSLGLAAISHNTFFVTTACVIMICVFALTVALARKMRGETVLSAVFLVSLYLTVFGSDQAVGIAFTIIAFSIAVVRAILSPNEAMQCNEL
jgi:hypothetical protein